MTEFKPESNSATYDPGRWYALIVNSRTQEVVRDPSVFTQFPLVETIGDYDVWVVTGTALPARVPHFSPDGVSVIDETWVLVHTDETHPADVAYHFEDFKMPRELALSWRDAVLIAENRNAYGMEEVPW
jgi:hypothetical protein